MASQLSPMTSSLDSFNCFSTIAVDSVDYGYFDLKKAEQNGLKGISRLPFSLRVLLENLLRCEDGNAVKKEDILAFSRWLQTGSLAHEIAFHPARVLMQDFTGVPAIVDLAAGECCWLCGANGSGKTSLLRLIAGFAPVIEGTIIYTRVADKSDISNYCHFINEQNGIKPFLTPQQWLQLYAKLLSVTNSVGDAGGQWSTKAWCADKALDHLGLARQRYMACKQLSQGQKKRLGLALLLVCPRPIWLLDEPFNSLDKTGSDLLSAMINQHIRDNGMVIIACHGRPGLAITTTVNLEPQAGQP